MQLKFLQDLWNDADARGLDEPELLRYRSNLLGRDLRITNFAGGNTSSKLTQADPVTGEPTTVLWVKGSGGDLGSIQRGGFAVLYQSKLDALKKRYRGAQFEDEMVDFYPVCAFGKSTAPASIDTPLHAFIPQPHVDHTHPDWAIAIAASANGQSRFAEFNQRFGRNIVWVPWQRPGFELGLMIERAIQANPRCDGIILASHGLFTWGKTQRESYLNTVTTIDQMGQFILERVGALGDKLFGGAKHPTLDNRVDVAAEIFPFVRGHVSQQKRFIGHYCDLPEVLRFANSQRAAELAYQGTSCPDHFIRTKIRPLYVDWDPKSQISNLKSQIEKCLEKYRADYAEYYRANATEGSPAMRDPNPTVVLVPGVGMFSFGKSKTEARITGEFYVNAIHVMEGATALGDGKIDAGIDAKQVLDNYVSLPLRETFRIEYWALEEAKLRRMPPEKEMQRRVVVVIGGGSGIGREAALRVAREGAQVVTADRDEKAATVVRDELNGKFGKECAASAAIDISNRSAVASAYRHAVLHFGGIDSVINTAAVFFPPDTKGQLADDKWKATFDVNVFGAYLVVDEAKTILLEQNLPASIVLTSSANAIMPKKGSEAYDVSKTATNHLVRELAIGCAPLIRVNGIAPATVVKGSTMFPRDRVIVSLNKYSIPFRESEDTEALRMKLAKFYADRTLTRQPIDPADCAEAIYWLASERSSKTTGHVIPVDGGLTDAFLR